MLNQKILQLVTSIKGKQFIQGLEQNRKQLTLQSALARLKQTELCHDELLKLSLELIDLVGQYANQNNQQIDVLVQQLERQKIQRYQDKRQFQENNLLVDCKLYDLRSAFNRREQQFNYLTAMIEEKDNKISQMQQEYKQFIIKLQQVYNNRTKEKIQVQLKQYEREINKINQIYDQKLSVLEKQNARFLTQNCILSDRLEQIMRYVKEQQQIKGSKDCLSPRVISQSNRETAPFKECESPLSESSSNNQHHRLLTQQSICSQSNQRMILHQILNTEDKRFVNFEENCVSKGRQQQFSGDQNNFSTLIRINQTRQKKNSIEKVLPNTVKQFKDNDGQSHLYANPYYIFFTITLQCARINSGRLQQTGTIDLASQWNTFIEKKIPLHEWYEYLSKKICQKLIITPVLSKSS